MRKKIAIIIINLLLILVSAFTLCACEESYTKNETDEIVNKLQTTLDTNKTELDEKIVELIEEYNAKDTDLLAKLNANEQSLANLKTNYEMELKKLQDKDVEIDKDIADLDSKYLAEVEKLVKQDTATAEELANLKTNYETELKKLQDKDVEIDKDIADLDSKYLTEVEKLQKSIDELNAQIETNNEIIKLLKTSSTSQQETITKLIERIEQLEQAFQDIHEHNYGELISYDYDENLFYQVCDECKEIRFKRGEHIWKSEYSSDDAFHWKECTSCSEIKDKQEHDENEDGKCSVCDKELLMAIYEVKDSSASVVGYKGNGTYLKIESEYNGYPVTRIGEYAFADCSSITKIEIPNSVTHIGWWAFSGCTSLTSVIIPNSVISIGEGVFAGCTSLESVIIPNGITHIYGWLFRGCESLQSIVIPNSVTTIGEYAFCLCTSLETIAIPNSVTSILEGAFRDCKSLKYNLKNGLKYLGNENNQYLCLVCPENTNITTATIDSNCRVIIAEAFSGCSSLQSIEIPNSVTSICDWAFSYCSSLTKVNYTGTIDQWVQIEFRVHNANPLYYVKNLYINNVLVTEANITTAKKISSYAFYGCDSLTSVTIGDSVTSIGYSAFENCTSLKIINFNGTMNKWNVIEKRFWWNDNVLATKVICSDGEVYFENN